MKLWSWILLAVVLVMLGISSFQNTRWDFSSKPTSTPAAPPAPPAPPAVDREAEERAAKQRFRAEVQEKTRIYQQKNEVLLRDFLSRLPYAGDSAFESARRHGETFVQQTTKVTFCTSLVYKMAKDRLTGSESLNEALAPIVRQEICAPLADGQAQIRNELENFLIRLRENNNQYRADLANLAGRPEFRSRDFVSSPDFTERMNRLEQQVTGFAIEKVCAVVSAGIDIALMRSLYTCIRNVAGHAVAKLAGTVSTSAICAAADGPLPIGDAVGAVLGVGGVIWTGYDIYKVPVKLPEELRTELNRLIDNSRTEMRSDAEAQAREAVRLADEAIFKLDD